MSDGTGITALAASLAAEVSLLTGVEMELFLDRSSIAWGDVWRSMIDEGLNDATFFIPVVTPRYFQRAECMKELFDFFELAESSGSERLIMPVLYTTVDDLSADSSDPARRILGARQHIDWRALRLVDRAASSYRSAVNSMATRLVELTQQSRSEESGNSQALRSDSQLGLAELIAEIEIHLPRWLDCVQSDQVWQAQSIAIQDTWFQRYDKLKGRNAPQSAIFSVLTKLSADLLPISRKHLEDAKVYEDTSLRLDRKVRQVIALVHEYPDTEELLIPLKEGVEEALETIKRWDEHADAITDQPFQSFAHLAKGMDELARISVALQPHILVGNAFATAWAAEMGMDTYGITNLGPAWWRETRAGRRWRSEMHRIIPPPNGKRAGLWDG